MLFLLCDRGRRTKTLPISQIEATYHKVKNELSSVVVALIVPGHAKETYLIREKSYELMTKDGKGLSCNLGQSLIKGIVSFKYVEKDNKREIAMQYHVDLPFSGHLESVTALCPT